MSTISSSKPNTAPSPSFTEIDDSDLQAARDFLLASSGASRHSRPAAPTSGHGHGHNHGHTQGQTVLRHGITRARFRSGSPAGN